MNEQFSAFIDSELDEDESARLISRLKHDAPLRAHWDLYHQIGDALRRTPQFSPTFMTRLGEQLALEPTVLAPRPQATHTQMPRPRYAMPIAASIAAFGLVGVLSWKLLPMQQAPDPSLQIAAQSNATMPVKLGSQQREIARVQFAQAIPNAYLLAHQEFSPSNAVEGMPAYIRTMSEQR